MDVNVSFKQVASGEICMSWTLTSVLSKEDDPYLTLLLQLFQLNLAIAHSCSCTLYSSMHFLVLPHSLPGVAQLLDVLHHLPLLTDWDAFVSHMMLHVPDLHSQSFVHSAHVRGLLGADSH